MKKKNRRPFCSKYVENVIDIFWARNKNNTLFYEYEYVVVEIGFSILTFIKPLVEEMWQLEFNIQTISCINF